MKSVLKCFPVVLVLITLALAVCFFLIPGCKEPTALYDGRQLTAEQINAASAAKVKAAADAAAADAKKAAEEVRSAQAAAKIAADKVQRDIALKLAKLKNNAEIDATATANEMADTLASGNEHLAGRLATILVDHEDVQNKFVAAASDAKALAEIAQADIQRQIEQNAALFKIGDMVINNPLTATAASAIPGGGAILGMLGSVLGIGGALYGRKQAVVAAVAKDDKEAAEEDTRSIVRGIENAKDKVPGLADKLKEAAGVILKEVTDGAHTIIEQKGVAPS